MMNSPDGKVIPLPELTDEELVEKTLRGDLKSFEKLVYRHRRSLYLFFTSSGLSEQDASDLSQEAFFRSYRYLKSYNPAFRFKTWLLQIARNQRADFFTERKRKPVRSLETVRSHPAAGRESDPIEIAGEREVEQRFLRALSTLPEPFAEAARLRFLQERSYEEIARLCEVSPGTVMSRLYRARKLLARFWNRERP